MKKFLSTLALAVMLLLPQMLQAQDAIPITVSANYTYMGTANPNYGTHYIADGTLFSVTFTPDSANGYCLKGFKETSVDQNGMGQYRISWLNAYNTESMYGYTYSKYYSYPTTITAIFGTSPEPLPTVAVNAWPYVDYMGTATGGGFYGIGDTVTVTATPAPGYHFVCWTGQPTYMDTVSLANPYTFPAQVNSDGLPYITTLYAVFAPGEVEHEDLVIGVNDPTLGTTNPAPGTYQFTYGSSLTITAIPSSGNSFVRWTDEDGATISMNNPLDYGIWTTGGTQTVVAQFVEGEYIPDSVTLTVAVNNPAWGTTTPTPGTYTFAENDLVQFLATPNSGYFVMGWAVSASMGGITMQDTMFGDAEFYTDFFDLVGVQNIVLTALFTDDSTYAPDRVYITFATNSPDMGTTNPAPGTYTYYDGDEYTVTAIPNDGYRLMGWTMSFIVEGQVITYPTDDAVPTITATAYADEGYNHYTLTAIFGPANVSADSLTIIVGVNDPNGGTVTPVVGTYHYGLGDQYSIEATANAGYHHVGWHVTVAHPVYGIVQDEVVNVPNITISGVVDDEELLGYVHTIIALFESNTGVDDVEAVNINAYGRDGHVVLSGAEGREVYVFDIYGRTLHHSRSANVTETYNVPATGIYLVKVAGFNAKRVVVLK